MRQLRLAVLLAVMTGCTEPSGAEEEGVPIWSLSASPTVEVGVVGGPEEYQFHRIAAVRRLVGGALLVADDGTLALSRYSPTGDFLGRSGGKGEGPGEYASLSGLHSTPADSLIVVDGWSRRVSVLDPLGSFVRVEERDPYSGDSTFTMDQWLHRRFWIVGAIEPAERERVRGILDQLPLPQGNVGFRRVVVADDGDLWIREPAPTDVTHWAIVNQTAQPVALVEMPAAFTPLTISSDEVIGRWQDANDVEYLRAYAVAPDDRTTLLPEWLLDPAGPATSTRPEDPMALMRPAVRALAIAQEMHYSTDNTYSANLETLAWESPEGIEASVAQADERGWIGLFWHPEWDFICAIGYGFTAPAGWPQGGPACAPSADRSEPQ